MLLYSFRILNLIGFISVSHGSVGISELEAFEYTPAVRSLAMLVFSVSWLAASLQVGRRTYIACGYC
jgi:hypothetical protein